MQRPTSPLKATVASPILTSWPIQASSSCASTPSISNSMRKRRPSISSATPASSRNRSSDARERSDTVPPPGQNVRSTAPSSAHSSSSGRPTKREIASCHGPMTRWDGRGSRYSSASTGSPSSTTPSTPSPSGNVSARRRVDSSQSGRMRIIEPSRLPAYNAPCSSRSQKRLLPTTPPSASKTSSGWTRPSDFTGATEMRTTRGSTPRIYLRRPFHLHLAAPTRALEVEDPEVAAGHVHRDVVDGDLADAPFERAGVRVTVQDEVGAALGDRRRQTVAAEQYVYARGLSHHRRLDGRVMEQHDA